MANCFDIIGYVVNNTIHCAIHTDNYETPIFVSSEDFVDAVCEDCFYAWFSNAVYPYNSPSYMPEYVYLDADAHL